MRQEAFSISDKQSVAPIAEDAFRFFKIFLVLTDVTCYKRLRSIYYLAEHYLAEKSENFRLMPTYNGQWRRYGFGPESLRFEQDLRKFCSMRWVVASPYFVRGEPIHYRYSLSLGGVAELASDRGLATFGDKIDSCVGLREFVPEIIAWKYLPVAVTLGMAMIEEPKEAGDEPQREDSCCVRFGHDMIEKLQLFYKKLFQEGTVSVTQSNDEYTIHVSDFDPNLARRRFNHLKPVFEFSSQDEEVELQSFLKKDIFPYSLYRNISPDSILKKVQEKRAIALSNRKRIEERIEKALDQVDTLFGGISKAGVSITFAKEGRVRLVLPPELEQGLGVEFRDAIWNLFQPTEIVSIMYYKDEDWLFQRYF